MKKTIVKLVAVAALVSSLSGCIALALTGAAVGALAVVDRRTIGAQTEDQGIEFKASDAIRTRVRSPGGISVTSFNRKVLISGQAPNEQAKKDAETLINKLDNVRSIHNELIVSDRVGFGTNTRDAGITAKVKGAFLEAADLSTNVFKVVTENATVYLLGIATNREGQRAAMVASRVSGVERVVTLFEYVTEEELAKLEAVNRDRK
jgi:osmotically-inducible protein OsmY